MPPIPEPDLSSTGGAYDVTESGINFRHVPTTLSTPKDGIEFLSRLQNNLQVKVLDRPSKNELVFELVGVDVSFANALRRIMIAEIPTMALEHVSLFSNLSFRLCGYKLLMPIISPNYHLLINLSLPSLLHTINNRYTCGTIRD